MYSPHESSPLPPLSNLCIQDTSKPLYVGVSRKTRSYLKASVAIDDCETDSIKRASAEESLVEAIKSSEMKVGSVTMVADKKFVWTGNNVVFDLVFITLSKGVLAAITGIVSMRTQDSHHKIILCLLDDDEKNRVQVSSDPFTNLAHTTPDGIAVKTVIETTLHELQAL